MYEERKSKNKWGNDTLNTYSGNINSPGPVDIKARDFEALLPNQESCSEFPSEHSCVCQVLMEFMDLYTDGMYGFTLTNIYINYADGTIFFSNMEDFQNQCAQSRVVGGYHYPASVIGGVQKCAGLGILGMEYVNQVRNNSNYNGGTYANSTPIGMSEFALRSAMDLAI